VRRDGDFNAEGAEDTEREGGREGGYLGLDAGEEEVRKESWAIVFPVEGLTAWGCRHCKSGVKPPHSKLLLSGE